MSAIGPENFCGQTVSPDQIKEIAEIAEMFPKLSRAELANTVCELFSWKRPTGRLKTIEAIQFLEDLQSRGVLPLPDLRQQERKQKKRNYKKRAKHVDDAPVTEDIKALKPLVLEKVETKAQRDVWYGLVDAHHYLGYRIPFGASMRYFLKSGQMPDRILGCFQFSSPAWRMNPRDEWIGWDDKKRGENLQGIINNSRFLILPWVNVKNLASAALGLVVKTAPKDWEEMYTYRPVLFETLVDSFRFTGKCYKAANWIHLGTTTGRGRNDRLSRKTGDAPKEIWVYPAVKNFREILCA